MQTELELVQRRYRLNWVVAGAALPVGLALALLLARVLPLTLIDFEHYVEGSRMLWRGQNPYGPVEFFAPPWIALLLAPLLPLSIKLASAIWILISVVCVGTIALISQQWSGASPRQGARLGAIVLMMLTPAAMFVYITGQISALVVLAVLVAARELFVVDRQPQSWVVAIGLAMATLKPNIIWLPAGLLTLELVRRRNWTIIGTCVAVLALLAVASFFRLPNWPASLLSAWRGGAYRGGVGLVAAGYLGLAELGVPWWFFGPMLVYLLWHWRRDGLDVWVLGQAFALCLLVTPYNRSYDHVVLVFPSLVCLSLLSGGRRLLGIALLTAAWLSPLLILAVLAPVLTSIVVLLAAPAAARTTPTQPVA